jgi:hypothetical protein
MKVALVISWVGYHLAAPDSDGILMHSMALKVVDYFSAPIFFFSINTYLLRRANNFHCSLRDFFEILTYVHSNSHPLYILIS